MTRVFHADGSAPAAGQVFVFGSNLSGIHGGGAARAAHQHYGAVWGAAEGQHGQSYALPTVQANIAGPLSLDEIRAGVDRFIAHAVANPDTEYFVTRVGCVLAGHKDADIAPMFANAPGNCSLPENWRQWLDADHIEPSTHLQNEADAIASDLEICRWKVGGGPVREHDARAVAIERGSRRYS